MDFDGFQIGRDKEEGILIELFVFLVDVGFYVFLQLLELVQLLCN